MFDTYVLFSGRIKKFYYGFTANLEKRLEHHNLGLDHWTKRGIPWKLVYKETYNTRREAMVRERFFKSGKGREFIRAEVAKAVTARV